MNIITCIEKSIEEDNVSLKEFGDIVIYLMHHGVICRPTQGTHSENDPVIEKGLYDAFIEVENQIVDYFSIMGVGLHHNKDFQTVRIFPPDADFPGNKNLIDDDGSSLMRLNIGKDISSALIVLSLLYEQYEAEKLEDFTVVINQVEFMNAFRSKLNLDVAEKISKTQKSKEDLFKSLKKLRVIRYHKNFFEPDSEYPIVIRPLIFDVVPQTIVLDILEEFSSNNKEEGSE